MTRPWWGKESRPPSGVRLRGRGPAQSPEPELAQSSRRAVFAELRGRIPAYTPEWMNQRKGDAGVALMQLFAEMSEPVLVRLNMLPRKSLVEFLRLAGSTPQWATSAESLVEFAVSDGAPQSVQIPEGFQIGARPATGEGDIVVFETKFSLFAAPSKLEKIFVQEGGLFSEIDPKGEEPFMPFGEKPTAGRALFIGLSGAVAPTSFLSVGFAAAAAGGTPPPVPSGGVEPRATPAQPLLRWDVLDGTSFRPAEVVRDETGGLVRTGVVELRLPRTWRTGTPEGLEEEDAALRWLRVRIAFGQYEKSPLVSFVRLNMARVVAARTIRDEILEHVPGSGGTQMRLSQTPVIPGTLVLEVDDGGGLTSDFDFGVAEDDAAGEAEGQTSTFGRRWKEVESLIDADADDEVYTLDPESGVVTFGDGVHGATVPQGFRNVRAASYRVGGGAAGAVDAGEIKTLLSSAPFVKGVTNPLRASGGTDRETQESAIRRGPQEFRARGRAVTVADYELLALGAPGAQVRRAHAVAGLHPSLPGRPVPGVVGVYVVPPDSGEGPPPVPDESSLRAVAEYLAAKLAPAGVEVVATPPRYHRIRALAGLIADPTADASVLVRRTLEELDKYLHPLTGGESGEGWPFGGVLQYAVLVRRLLANVEGLLALPRLNFIIDGARVPGCADFTPAPHALFWPSGHEVVVLDKEEGL